MGGFGTRSRVLAAVACLGAVLVVGQSGAAANGGTGGGSGSFAAGGTAVDGPRTRTPVVTLTPTVTYPANALCDTLGFGQDSTVQVDGTKFSRSKAFTVTLGSKSVATGTTTATGTFSTTFEDPQQPFGSYVITAKTGRKSGTANLTSSAQSCWSAVGTSGTALSWNWQGSGFDANTTATLKVAGTPVQSATASAKGQFTKAFTAACPVGPRAVTLVASFGGVVAEYASGTVAC